ncbi:MFS general substrate transporter [Polychaeton citri CBS 116435]|uniref:MFS general substrate transporter n=1 Tax=Polychaeton citri CBS 116435 TaxID=1314669 RepID=A0A9P4Q542_9PEZI|nr:MFS general substrate transporter [Polychaeton citri CBS 116435]
MTDVGSHHFVKSSSHVLVPQPSADPHDPLNWSWMWKTFTIAASTSVSFTQGLGPLALAPMFPYYIEDFNSNLADVVKFTGVAILVLGFSNFIWVPISTTFGRRPVYILSQTICFVSSIWRAVAKDYGSFMGACVLNGIGAGPGETIQPAVIADIFFLHDRGFWNTLYWVSYMGGLMVGPIISGSMALHVGWRIFWWFNTGLIGASLLMVVFMFPETKWHRLHPSEVVADSVASSSKEDGTDDEKHSKIITQTQPNSSMTGLTQVPRADRSLWLGRGSPSKAQWRLFQPPRGDVFKTILMDLWIPWKLFAFPIVEYSAFVVSWSCSCFLTLNLTQSLNFAAAPYSLDSQTIGFFNFAILIGACIGLATAGPISDWVSARQTRKNGGIREPEMRLLATIPYTLIMILGNFIVAFGYERKWHWAVIVVIGYACAGIQVAALPAMATTYSVDSYKPVAGSLMVAITVNKNLWGYGFAEFIIPWVEESGFISPIMTNMSLTALWCLFGILFYFKGKTFRRWSKNSSVHKL